MFYAIDEGTGAKVYAKKAVNMHTSFYCPCCKEPVIIKNGMEKATHFAHRSKSHCDTYYSSSNVMSEWHRNWQERFPEECREVVITKGNEKHIADICYNRYVVEFQHSSLSPEDFIERTKFYVKCGYKVIWIFDFSEECSTETSYGEFKLQEYDEGKWMWKNPKRTFSNFNPCFDYWRNNVMLMFEDDCENIRKITWCIHKFDEQKSCYINSYSRFCTYKSKIWDKEELIKAILKKKD